MHQLAKLVVVLSVIACSKKSDAPKEQPKPVPEQAPAELKDPRSAKTKTPLAPADDAAFQKASEEIAKALSANVIAYGTAELDDKPGPDRWATLYSDPGYGAYFVQTPDKLWLVGFSADGRTSAWHAGEQLAWTVRPDTDITHQQGHHGGYETHQLAVRNGDFVVLRKQYLENVREKDEVEKTAYADDKGVCSKPCPLATTADFKVASGATVEEIVKAAPSVKP